MHHTTLVELLHNCRATTYLYQSVQIYTKQLTACYVHSRDYAVIAVRLPMTAVPELEQAPDDSRLGVNMS